MTVIKVLVNKEWVIMSTRSWPPAKAREIVNQLREIGIPAKPALA